MTIYRSFAVQCISYATLIRSAVSQLCGELPSIICSLRKSDSATSMHSLLHTRPQFGDLNDLTARDDLDIQYIVGWK